MDIYNPNGTSFDAYDSVVVYIWHRKQACEDSSNWSFFWTQKRGVFSILRDQQWIGWSFVCLKENSMKSHVSVNFHLSYMCFWLSWLDSSTFFSFLAIHYICHLFLVRLWSLPTQCVFFVCVVLNVHANWTPKNKGAYHLLVHLSIVIHVAYKLL